MSHTAISVEGLSKWFRLEQEHSLRARLWPFGRERSGFHALRDVHLEVTSGSTVGLLGHNGSGKSTLLKCIAGILAPTEGRVRVAGRVAAMLELGIGFSPELTGRENVYLNGSILGLSRREIDRRFDTIVDFSGIAPFIDQQVKHYSSGMYLRLGFAVAVNVDPDILLIDEVLTVGDEAFQRACIGRIREFQREGRTVVIVTHAPDLVRQLCDRAIVLDHGDVVLDGGTRDAIRSFRAHMYLGRALVDQVEQAQVAGGDDGRVARITQVRFEHPGTAEGRRLRPHEPLRVVVEYEAREPVEAALFGIAIHDTAGNLLYGANTRMLDIEVPTLHGAGSVVFDFPDVALHDGTYPVTLAIQSLDESTVYDWHDQEYQFEVASVDRLQGLVALPVQVALGGPTEAGQ